MKLRKEIEEIPSFLKRESEKQKSLKKPVKNSENIHSGHRDRLKTQYLNNGLKSMTDIQKLELLLFYAIPQKDTNPIAHALLKTFGSLKDVLSANVSELIKVEGIKENTALFLNLVRDMTNVCSLPNDKDLITGTTDAKDFCSKLFIGSKVEEFYVICLSSNNRIINSKLICSGTTDEIPLQIRDITEFAINSNCNRIIVAHNHPHGEAKLSDSDNKFTYSLLCSCLLNSIDILDHIVVGFDNKCFSSADALIIQRLKERAMKTILIEKETQLFISNSSSAYTIDSPIEYELNI